ncbi:MAG: transposase [Deltaproteobacteria bacterium]|nr:transposase [Deltaproteobacteria bacterium]
MKHSITKSLVNEFQSTKLSTQIKKTFRSLNVGIIANKSHIRKEQGLSSMDILYRIVLLPFFKEKLTGLWKESFLPDNLRDSGKDTYYPFLANHRYHWRKFINLLALKVISKLQSFSLWHERVLILDDSTLPKRGKQIELVSWVYDSVTQKSTLAFKTLVLGWHDRLSFIPFDFSLVASSNRSNTHLKPLDNRTIGAGRRREALKSKTELALDMIKKARNSGLDAGFVLFDSWFAFPSFIKKVHDAGYNVICKLKKLPNMRYLYQGREYNLNELYRKFAKNRLASLPTLPGKSVAITVMTKENLPVKILFYLDGKHNDWCAFLSTVLEIEEEKILKTYAGRWSIEPFFKECKQHLHLGKEQNRNFDSIFASTALAMARYLFLAFNSRFDNDPRTLGELFKAYQVDLQQLSASQTVMALIADEINALSRTQKTPEMICSQITKLVNSIKYFLTSPLRLNEPLGCKT